MCYVRIQLCSYKTEILFFVLTKMLSHHGIAFYDRNKICLELLTMTICRLFFLLFVKGIRPNTILHGGILYQHRSCRTYSCLYLTVLFPYFFARLFLLRVEGIQLWPDFSPWDTSPSKKVLVSVRLGFFFTANCPTEKSPMVKNPKGETFRCHGRTLLQRIMGRYILYIAIYIYI